MRELEGQGNTLWSESKIVEFRFFRGGAVMPQSRFAHNRGWLK